MLKTTMTLEEWRAAGRHFRYRGHEIFYQEGGQGPVLLCLHGFPTGSWDWHLIWPALTARFRVIAPDMIGFGFSAKPVGYGYCIHDQADLVEALMAHAGVTSAHLLACDYGDTVAQELLARVAERRARGGQGLVIESACLLNGGLFPEAHHVRRIQRLLSGRFGWLFARMMSRGAIARAVAATAGPVNPPSRRDVDAFWRLVRHNRGTRVLHKLARYVKERRQHRDRWVAAIVDPSAEAPPIRLVSGYADPASGRHMAARYRQLARAADVVSLDGVGHYPHLEDTVAVIDALFAFHDAPRETDRARGADGAPAC